MSVQFELLTLQQDVHLRLRLEDANWPSLAVHNIYVMVIFLVHKALTIDECSHNVLSNIFSNRFYIQEDHCNAEQSDGPDQIRRLVLRLFPNVNDLFYLWP